MEYYYKCYITQNWVVKITMHYFHQSAEPVYRLVRLVGSTAADCGSYTSGCAWSCLSIFWPPLGQWAACPSRAESATSLHNFVPAAKQECLRHLRQTVLRSAEAQSALRLSGAAQWLLKVCTQEALATPLFDLWTGKLTQLQFGAYCGGNFDVQNWQF